MKVKITLLVVVALMCLVNPGRSQSPSYKWTKTYGGNGRDVSRGICVDEYGNTYVIGVFKNTVDFDPGIGVENRTSNGYTDVYVQKLDADGNLIWVTTFGSPFEDYGIDIAVDSSGEIYLTGYFSDMIDFDPGLGNDYHVSNGNYDVFIEKLDVNGNYLWAKTFGGVDNDYGNSVYFDEAGDVYLTGTFSNSVDFDPDMGVETHVSNGSSDIYLQKLDANGNFIWVKTIGGMIGEYSSSVKINDLGDIFIVGSFSDTVDFDPGIGTDFRISNGSSDVFVEKLDLNGNLIWVKAFGGISDDHCIDLSMDNDGHICLTGEFMGTVDFNPGIGVENLTSNGYADVFIQKLDPNGDFIWVKSIGGINDEHVIGISVNTSGDIFIAGSFNSETMDFDPGVGVSNYTSNGGLDVFVEELDANGNFIWANTFGSPGFDKGYGISTDAIGNIYITGFFSDTVDFYPGAGEDDHISNGDFDIFVQKLGPEIASVETVIKSGLFNTYPNPTKGILNIAIDSDEVCSVKVLNVMGQVVASKNNIYSQAVLDISQQVDGVYFVQVHSENRTVSSKVILQK